MARGNWYVENPGTIYPNPSRVMNVSNHIKWKIPPSHKMMIVPVRLHTPAGSLSSLAWCGWVMDVRGGRIINNTFFRGEWNGNNNVARRDSMGKIEGTITIECDRETCGCEIETNLKKPNNNSNLVNCT